VVPKPLSEDGRNSISQSTDFFYTPPSTPHLGSPSSFTLTRDSSVCSVSGSRPSDRRGPRSKGRSKLSSTSQFCTEIENQGFQTSFEEVTEEQALSNMTAGQALDSATVRSGSPELGALDSVRLWSQSIPDSSVLSHQPSLAPSPDEASNSSDIQTEKSNETPLPSSLHTISNAILPEGKFIY
jgi:hypothetical protein